MKTFVTYLLCLAFVGCATADQRPQTTAAYLAKQAIAESNNTPVSYGCPAVPITNEHGNIVPAVDLNYTKLSETVVSDFTDILKEADSEGEGRDDALADYLPTVSFESKRLSFGVLHCWTGNQYNYAQIDKLKDINTTWIGILIRNGGAPLGARKCTYASNPNEWTTEVCPNAEGSVG